MLSPKTHLHHPVKVMKFVLTMAAAIAGSAAHAAGDKAACERLARLALQHGQVLTAEWVATGTLPASFGMPDGSSGLPDFCLIKGETEPTVRSQINLEVWLPAAKNWTGRYYQHGEGGGGGKINHAAMAGFILGGAAAAATDDGNQSPWLDAIGNTDAVYRRAAQAREVPERIIDNWGYIRVSQHRIYTDRLDA